MFLLPQKPAKTYMYTWQFQGFDVSNFITRKAILYYLNRENMQFNHDTSFKMFAF